MNNFIKNHRVFNPEDYERLQNKGYSDSEVIEIWNKDLKQRVLSDLLWLEAQSPEAVKTILAEFEEFKGKNPFTSNPINHA